MGFAASPASLCLPRLCAQPILRARNPTRLSEGPLLRARRTRYAQGVLPTVTQRRPRPHANLAVWKHVRLPSIASWDRSQTEALGSVA
jgi:hypothetical protein